MIGYIYLTHDILKNKVYVGQHKSEIYDSNYFGSGKIISRIIKKRKDTLRNYVLEWCENLDTLDESEIRWIAYFREEFGEENCYNILSGGRGYEFTEEARKNMSKPRKKRWHLSDETRKNMSIAKKKEASEISPERRAELNKKISEGTKEAMNRPEIRERFLEANSKVNRTGENNSAFGRKWMNNGVEQIYPKVEEQEYYLALGYKFGMLKFRWQTPSGEIRIMDNVCARRDHPDWVLIGLVE